MTRAGGGEGRAGRGRSGARGGGSEGAAGEERLHRVPRHDEQGRRARASTEVAAKYQGKPDNEAYLAKKIKAGGEGVWGPVPMPPQPALKDDEARAIAKWIAGGAK